MGACDRAHTTGRMQCAPTCLIRGGKMILNEFRQLAEMEWQKTQEIRTNLSSCSIISMSLLNRRGALHAPRLHAF